MGNVDVLRCNNKTEPARAHNLVCSGKDASKHRTPLGSRALHDGVHRGSMAHWHRSMWQAISLRYLTVYCALKQACGRADKDSCPCRCWRWHACHRQHTYVCCQAAPQQLPTVVAGSCRVVIMTLPSSCPPDTVCSTLMCEHTHVWARCSQLRHCSASCSVVCALSEAVPETYHEPMSSVWVVRRRARFRMQSMSVREMCTIRHFPCTVGCHGSAWAVHGGPYAYVDHICGLLSSSTDVLVGVKRECWHFAERRREWLAVACV